MSPTSATPIKLKAQTNQASTKRADAVPFDAAPSFWRSAILYALTTMSSAFLLFQIELMMGKYLLPRFGGGPSVWSTSLLIFQVFLLIGYGYAAFSCARLSPRSQAGFHLGLLGVSAIVAFYFAMSLHPSTSAVSTKPVAESPVWNITLLLVTSVGMQCVLLSATSPLLQSWFGRSHSASPYRLYALSNLGSMVGLLGYPFLVERFLTLSTQVWLWAVTYAVFVLMASGCALLFMRKAAIPVIVQDLKPEKTRKPKKIVAKDSRILWLLLAACSSAMLLATTNLICQQVAPIPMLWVVPLSLYLLSFIVCFDHARWYRREIFQPLYLVMALVALRALPNYSLISITELLVTYSFALFAVCMVCHGELARLKPEPERLTSYFLLISAGSALGGAAVVLLAPRIFDRFWEFQIALVGSGILIGVALVRDNASWTHRLRLGKVMLALSLIGLCAGTWYFTNELLEWEESDITAACIRNFFGVKTVWHEEDRVDLLHGHTLHGFQNTDPQQRNEPTGYYARDTGIGLLLENFPRPSGKSLRVGVIGMGVGTLAAYGQPGDYYHFYEIDPSIPEFSRGDQPMFTFVQKSSARIDVEVGDARIRLEDEDLRHDPQNFDVLVVDAFSGDFIPVHLLTREAMSLYLRHLHDSDSVIAFHLSSPGLDLPPVVANLAQSYQLAVTEIDGPSPWDPIWVLCSRNLEALRRSDVNATAHPVKISKPQRVWTDDYSSLYEAVRWW